MKLEYKIEENDYLQYQLYTASKTERIKKQRIKSWILVSLLFYIISLLFLINENKMAFYSFMIFGFITLIFYPSYLRKHYKEHYSKFIKENYKNRFDERLVIEFFENELMSNDSNSESKVKYSAFEEFNEIGDFIFLKLKSSSSFIIPKLKIDNLEELKVELNTIAEKYNIKQNVELNWRWK